MGLQIQNYLSGIRALLGIVSRRRVFGGPRTVALIMANECNSSCIMCWYHSPLIPGNEPPKEAKTVAAEPNDRHFMDPALCETILREVHEMGTFRVVLGGAGEPTLHPQLDAILDLLERLEMLPYVITNGIAVDEARARSWAKKRAHFRFSVHAGDVETWLRVHPTLTSFQFENLSRVIKLLAKSDSARVSTMHVIQKANFRHVREMIEHARSLDVREVLFFPVRINTDLTQVILSPDEEKELCEELRLGSRLAESLGIRTNLGEYLTTNRYIRSGFASTAHLYRRIPCYVGWIYTEFDIDGTIRPCENSSVVMGRAGETRIKDTWLSTPYQVFRCQALTIPERLDFVKGCPCDACSMAKFNLNVYNLLHLKAIKYDEA